MELDRTLAQLRAREGLSAEQRNLLLEPEGIWAVFRQGQTGVLLAGPQGLGLAMDGEVDLAYIPWGSLTQVSSPAPFAVQIESVGREGIRLGFKSAAEAKAFTSAVARHMAGPDPVRATSSEAPPLGSDQQPDRDQQSGIRARRERSRRMIDALAQSKKYRMPLEGERFAYVSLLGTNDWEDSASLAFRAMTLEAILDLDQRAEQMASSLARIERYLATIAEGMASPPTSTTD